MKTKKENLILTTEEKPGKGRYACIRCGFTVTLDDDTDALPECPKCLGTRYRHKI
jgi:DNA-directed RNA polymerase subunit RPC12/RpoP